MIGGRIIGTHAMYKMKNGESVEIVSKYKDRIVVLYNGVCLDRPAEIIGKLIFPADYDFSDEDNIPNTAEQLDVLSARLAEENSLKSEAEQKSDKKHRKAITPGDTVCLKFFSTYKKAIYTISADNSDVTIDSILFDEGTIANDTPLALALIGKCANDIVTFTSDEDVVVVVQILSFFKKTTGIYQKLKEQRESQKLLDDQRKKKERAEKLAKQSRGIKTGHTVCVEFLDTKEKKAFKIVEAWVNSIVNATTKPYRPTAHDSKTITQANPDEDTISETSPLAAALLGKSRGDIVKYKVGDRTNEVRIIAFFDNDRWLENQKSSSGHS